MYDCVIYAPMKNRAKCKLCQSVIESFHSTDYVICKCGHIALDGGDAMRCFAKDWNNFLRVDDNDNEIPVQVKGEEANAFDAPSTKPTRKELIEMLDSMIKNIENLPQAAMTAPITHYDFVSALLLLSEIAKSDLA